MNFSSPIINEFIVYVTPFYEYAWVINDNYATQLLTLNWLKYGKNNSCLYHLTHYGTLIIKRKTLHFKRRKLSIYIKNFHELWCFVHVVVAGLYMDKEKVFWLMGQWANVIFSSSVLSHIACWIFPQKLMNIIDDLLLQYIFDVIQGLTFICLI